MSESKFKWSSQPKTQDEFESLMQAVDKILANRGLHLFQRVYHAPALFWEAFGWEGPILPPKELANAPGFDGPVLMAKAHLWYEECYGQRINSHGAFGHFPAKLGNSLWSVRAGVVWGTVEFFIDLNLRNFGSPAATRGEKATANVLCAVKDLPQGLASRLTADEAKEFFGLFQLGMGSLMWRHDSLKGDLFEVARSDYAACTEDLLGGRFSQARWGAQQSAEKTLKGLLNNGGTAPPTSGPRGHDIKFLGTLLANNHGVSLSDKLLEAVACSTRVRYGEEPSTETQALRANHAVLGILEQLRMNPRTAELLIPSRRTS